MDLVLLALRLVLAGVFGLAAVTKLADLPGSRSALEGFGLPKRLAAPAGVALPLIEGTIAIFVLPVTTSWWGSLAGLVLLLAFIGGITYTLSQGRQPDCHCFGQVYSEPIGTSTLVRNGVLAVLAGVLVLRGPDGQGASLVAWIDDVSTIDRVQLSMTAVALAGVAGLGWILFQLLQQNGRLLIRIEALEAAPTLPAPADRPVDRPSAGLPVGTAAPAFGLSDLDGETVTLDDLRVGGKPVLLVFTDPKCAPCNALAPEIGRWQRGHAKAFSLVPVSRGSRDANAAKASEHGIDRVLLQQDREVSTLYQSVPTPSAVLIRPDGTIGEPAAVGSAEIRNLVAGLMVLSRPIFPGSRNGNGHHPVPELTRRPASGPNDPD